MREINGHVPMTLLFAPAHARQSCTFSCLQSQYPMHFVCRPLLHALYNPGIKSAFGIELDQVKVSEALPFP